MPEARGRVSGTNSSRSVRLYALSTCIWCRRTRELLEKSDVSFDFVYVDLLEGEERETAQSAVKRWNPAISFPTLVVDNSTVVVGFQPDKIKEALSL